MTSAKVTLIIQLEKLRSFSYFLGNCGFIITQGYVGGDEFGLIKGTLKKGEEPFNTFILLHNPSIQ